MVISDVKCLYLRNPTLQYICCNGNFVVVLLVSSSSESVIIGYLLSYLLTGNSLIFVYQLTIN